jgi:hypothetical protein
VQALRRRKKYRPPLGGPFAFEIKSPFIVAVWCGGHGLVALPASPAGVCGFLADEATRGRRASTLGRRLAAIRYFYRAAGLETPTGDEQVKAVLFGIRRTIGAAAVRKKAATDIVLGTGCRNGISVRRTSPRSGRLATRWSRPARGLGSGGELGCLVRAVTKPDAVEVTVRHPYR